MGLTQTSFTERENEFVVLVCAKFTKYNIRPDCPMEAVININFATLNNTAGIHTLYVYYTICILTMSFVGTCMCVYLLPTNVKWQTILPSMLLIHDYI